MEKGAVVKAWGLILGGYQPNLSIEITRECPLRCPGCYAYGDTHLGGDVVLRELADYKGQELIDGVMEVVREPHRTVGPDGDAVRAPDGARAPRTQELPVAIEHDA